VVALLGELAIPRNAVVAPVVAVELTLKAVVLAAESAMTSPGFPVVESVVTEVQSFVAVLPSSKLMFAVPHVPAQASSAPTEPMTRTEQSEAARRRPAASVLT
jgi:hypothetical protein